MLTPFRPYIGEISIAALGIWWGLNLLNPYTDSFSVSQATANLGLIDENFWGLFAVGLGIAQLYGLKYRGFAHYASLFNATFWFLVAFAIASKYWFSMQVPAYGVFSLISLGNYFLSTKKYPSIGEAYRATNTQ